MGIWVLFFSCSPNELDTRNEDYILDLKVKTEEPVLLEIPNLFPEGLEYDHWNNRFIVSVALHGTIGVIEDGEFKTFIDDHVLVVPLGTQIDQARQRLLVANADHGFGIKSGAPLSIGGLASYDLGGNLLFYADFTQLNLGYYFPNDVAVDHLGNAYVTDSFNGVIYKVDSKGNPNVFYSDPALATMPNAVGMNGIEYDPKGFLLVTHTTGNKLYKFPMDNPAAFTEVDLSASLSSPDGIYLRTPNELWIANNDFGGENGKVQVFKTTDQWKSAILQEVHMLPHAYPSTVTERRGVPYVLNSYIHYFFAGMERSVFEIVPLE